MHRRSHFIAAGGAFVQIALTLIHFSRDRGSRVNSKLVFLVNVIQRREIAVNYVAMTLLLPHDAPPINGHQRIRFALQLL